MNRFKILLIIMVFFFSVDASMAQTDRKEQRKTERAEKKRLKEEARQERMSLIKEITEERSFVLEAHSISGRRGMTYQVSPVTNFVMVEGNQVVIQTGNNFGFGYNGVGGITVQGDIKDYEIISRKKNSVSVLLHFSEPVFGHSSLNIDISENGFATARMIGNWGSRINFSGQFVPLENSRVFEGRPVI